jgi:hypothetical protein
MDIVEESEEFNIKQLVNYKSYIEEKSNNSPYTERSNDNTEMEAIQEKSKKKKKKKKKKKEQKIKRNKPIKKEKCFSSTNYKMLCRFEVLWRELV